MFVISARAPAATENKNEKKKTKQKIDEKQETTT